MSLTGNIHIYAHHRPVDLEAVFFRVAQWTGSAKIGLISEGIAVLEGGPFEGDAALGFSEHDLVPNIDTASPEDFWKCYREGYVLHGTFADSPRADELADGFTNGIDAKIRGKFMPQDLSISIGQFRLIDAFKNDGEVVGLPFFDVSFFGYGIPEDWATTRAQIRTLPIMVKFQQELTEIVGQQMKIEALWSC